MRLLIFLILIIGIRSECQEGEFTYVNWISQFDSCADAGMLSISVEGCEGLFTGSLQYYELTSITYGPPFGPYGPTQYTCQKAVDYVSECTFDRNSNSNELFSGSVFDSYWETTLAEDPPQTHYASLDKTGSDWISNGVFSKLQRVVGGSANCGSRTHRTNCEFACPSCPFNPPQARSDWCICIPPDYTELTCRTECDRVHPNGAMKYIRRFPTCTGTHCIDDCGVEKCQDDSDPPCDTSGCMDERADNYDEYATTNDTSCIFRYGCMDERADNYDELAIFNASCIFTPSCADPNMFNYSPEALNNFSCTPWKYGCMDPAYMEYDPSYNVYVDHVVENRGSYHPRSCQTVNCEYIKQIWDTNTCCS